jgi:hypothetical protein
MRQVLSRTSPPYVSDVCSLSIPSLHIGSLYPLAALAALAAPSAAPLRHPLASTFPAGAIDEQSRRRYAAMEALSLGHGGVSAMSRISGLARSTINRGIADIRARMSAPAGRIRKPGVGAGAKSSRIPRCSAI